MKIYIAGKISGLEYEEAESLFMFAETVVEKHGHTPLNPMKIVDQREVVFGAMNTYELPRTYNDQLLDAIRIVLEQADALYMLPNWRKSFGARIEHAVAEVMGKPIFYAASELPVGSDWPEQVTN